MCQDSEGYIKAGESHVNRDENQCFLDLNNLWFIMSTQFYNLYNPISKYKNNLYLLDNILVTLQGQSQPHIMNHDHQAVACGQHVSIKTWQHSISPSLIMNYIFVKMWVVLESNKYGKPLLSSRLCNCSFWTTMPFSTNYSSSTIPV